jgi:plasmid stabilization system protein ParE
MAMQYRLSGHALRNLRNIYRYSCDTWGEAQADIYVEHLYAGFSSLAAHPDRDHSRRQRSQPFQMIACQKTFRCL